MPTFELRSDAALIWKSLSVARGWDLRTVAILLGTSATSWLLGKLTLQLRTAADVMVESPVLDRMILVGLVLPVAVIVRCQEDRCAWLLATCARPAWVIRAAYLASVYAISLGLAAALAWTTSGQQSHLLVFSDFALLLGLGSAAAVIFGAQLAWTVPAAVALACSTPGLIPLAVNAPARADQAWNILCAGGFLLTLAFALFLRFDDYGLDRNRILARTSGITDE